MEKSNVFGGNEIKEKPVQAGFKYSSVEVDFRQIGYVCEGMIYETNGDVRQVHEDLMEEVDFSKCKSLVEMIKLCADEMLQLGIDRRESSRIIAAFLIWWATRYGGVSPFFNRVSALQQMVTVSAYQKNFKLIDNSNDLYPTNAEVRTAFNEAASFIVAKNLVDTNFEREVSQFMIHLRETLKSAMENNSDFMYKRIVEFNTMF